MPFSSLRYRVRHDRRHLERGCGQYWSNTANWTRSGTNPPNSSFQSVCIDNGNATASTVILDISVSVANRTIDSHDKLIATLFVAGPPISNANTAGGIAINAGASNVVPQLAGKCQLWGGRNEHS